MTTGAFENFSGTIADIGPMYPFVGSEWLWLILAIVFWLGWHIRQIRQENREYHQEREKYMSREILQRVFEREEKDPGV